MKAGFEVDEVVRERLKRKKCTKISESSQNKE